MTEEVFRETFASGGVVGGHGFFAAVVDIEAGVFPSEEVGEFFRADELGVPQGVEEAVAEEFDGGSQVFGGHAVEAAVGGEESVGGKDVEVGVVDEVIAEGVDSGDGPDAAVREAEANSEGVLEGGGGSVEEVGEEVAALAKDAAQDLGDGEDELAVGEWGQSSQFIIFLVETELAVCWFHSKSSFGKSVWRIMERRVPMGVSLRGCGTMAVFCLGVAVFGVTSGLGDEVEVVGLDDFQKLLG